MLWKNSLMETHVKNCLMRGHPEFHSLDTADSKNTSRINTANGVLPLWKLQLHSFIIWIYFAETTLFSSNSDMLYQKVFLLHKSPVWQLLWSYLDVALTLFWYLKNKPSYHTLFSQKEVLLQLHKLKGTLSIWGIAINVRCCY